MNTTYWSHAWRKGVAGVLMLATVATWFMWPQTTEAATIVSDGFGTSTSNSNDIENWNEEGNDNDSTTLARAAQGSGEDIASPNGGRFAKIGEDEWICRQIDSTNRYNLTLKYYWNGDSDAENNEDYGIVEYRATNNGNTDQSCNSNANSWDQLASHELHEDTNWSGLQTISLPDELDNDSSWFIRYRSIASSDSEYFRVDGVLIEGDIPDTTAPTVTINQAAGQVDPTTASPIEFTVVFSEPVTGFDATDVLLSGTAGATTKNVTGGPTTYTVDVSGMTNDGTVIATIPAGAAEDGAGNDSGASSSLDNEVTYEMPNRAPVAQAVSESTQEDTPVSVTLSATDPDGDPLTWTIIGIGPDGDTDPSSGSLTAGPHFVYTPDPDYNGVDDFMYQVSDGEFTDSAEIEINVSPVAETCPDGQHMNEYEQCVPNAPDPETPEQCVVVSDDETVVLDGEVSENATELAIPYIHPVWDHTLETVAKWIWGDSYVENTTIDETQVFTRTFSLEEAPTSATLTLASDNGYLVEVNGVQMGTNELGTFDPNPPHTFNPTTDIAVTNLVAGTNTLEITVINKATEDTNPQNNPAGLIYRLTVNGSDCGTPAPVAVCQPEVELLANGSFELPAVTNGALWDIFPTGTPGLAWVADWLTGNISAPEVANVELQKTGLNGWSASAGTQWTELDSDWGGPSSGQSGEEGQVAISQTIATVPNETYTLSFDFSPRPSTADTQNKIEVLQNGVVFGTVGPLVGGGNVSWTSHEFSFTATSSQSVTTVTFRDAGSANDSVGTFVDNASLMCQEPEPRATLIATKIVCPTEDLLPNWGQGGANITATTAADFLEENPTCSLQPDWQFEWVTNTASSTNPGDNSGVSAGAPWSLMGLTGNDGTVSAQIPVGDKVWVREILKAGYVSFSSWLSGNESDPFVEGDDVSAEIYCSTDVLNYDNWDWIDPVQEGQTYYCVAFNAPEEGSDVCNPNASKVLLSSDGDDDLFTTNEGNPAEIVGEFIHSSWVDAIDALWIWKDSGTSEEDAANGITEEFTRTFEIEGTPFDSTLEIAADNGYSVEVNGSPVCADADEDNYSATTTCAIPAALLLNGENEITFTIVNLDHATENTPTTNPAGLLYKLTVNENECEIPPAPFSTVTMCKTDVEGDPLMNWTLMLQGDEVETVNVAVNNPAGTNTTTVLDEDVSYLAIASGLWLNSGQTGNWVDAEYSTTDGWVTPFDGFFGYSSDILELQINSEFDPGSNWGPYASNHVYAQSFVQNADGAANFRIYDGHPVPTVQNGWYEDNVQSTLEVDLYEGYAGVTNEDGCVVFEDVPYGTYSATELLKSGWAHYATWDGETVIDGTTVAVNSQNETFTIQNRLIDDEGDNEDTGTLIIEKRTDTEDGTFTFDIGGNENVLGASITTEEGFGSESIDLAPGLYAVSEDVQDDWELESVSCSYEGEGEEGDVSVPNNAITIVEGETVTCVFENVYDPNSTPENGGGVNRNMGGGDGDTDGSVLGAATESCEPLLSTFLGLNRENDMTEVTELQTFLNDHMGAGLPVSGFFGPMTDGAVKTFQLQYWEEVLQPWFNIPGSAILDQDDATGFVYKTTQRMVNNIFCPSLNLPMPELP